jgi:hypothetical protein
MNHATCHSKIQGSFVNKSPLKNVKMRSRILFTAANNSTFFQAGGGNFGENIWEYRSRNFLAKFS